MDGTTMHMLRRRRPASDRRRLSAQSPAQAKVVVLAATGYDDATATSHTRAMRRIPTTQRRFSGLRYAMHQPDGRHPRKWCANWRPAAWALRVQARVSARRRGLGGEPGGQDRGIDGWLPLRWPNVRATYA